MQENKQIPLFKVNISENAIAVATRVLRSSFIGQGPEVDEFEKSLRSYLKREYIATVNSGTSALHLVIKLLEQPCEIINERDAALGILSSLKWSGFQKGDEVLLTSLTCMASSTPFALAGYDLKWVDIDPTTCNFSLDDLESKISPKTKIILAMHWGGNPIDLKRLEKICSNAEKNYGFRPIIIQDCAHALGATLNDEPLCYYGDFAFYSFQAIKHVTSVDGGCLVVPNNQMNKKARLLRWYGIDRDTPRADFRCESDILEIGTKWHMNDVCAAIGNENLKDIDRVPEDYRDNANYYLSNLHLDGLKLPEILPTANPAWWLFTLRVKERDNFMKAMASRGIQTSRVHERNDKHSCYANFKTELPNLDTLCKEMVCIPVGYWVFENHREYIVDAIKKGW